MARRDRAGRRAHHGGECRALEAFDFVFVSVDDGPARLLIVDWLSAQGIPYVDCGMGLNRSTVGLSGFVRITGVDRKAFDDNVGTVRLPVENAKEDEYRKQAQITELNALNADDGRHPVQAALRASRSPGRRRRCYIFDSATFEID